MQQNVDKVRKQRLKTKGKMERIRFALGQKVLPLQTNFHISCSMASHLTQQQRYEISFRLQNKERPISIAQALGVHRSTICREIKRNKKPRGDYDAELAQSLSQKRLHSRHHYTVLTDDMRSRIDHLITQHQWSPEQISGRLRLLGEPTVSHETIYRYVWHEKRIWGKDLYKHLRHRGRRYNKRGSSYKSRGIPGRVGIEERPPVVELRNRFGDLEMDTIIGKNKRSVIMTINDRESGFLIMRKLPSKEAEPLAHAAVNALRRIKNELHTITADNGSEFAKHQFIADMLGVKVFFARPYHSWERGANENTNGLIRQYFIKGSDFDPISEKQIKIVQKKINNRPRKRLGFYTPLEFIEHKYHNNKTILKLLRY
jgi:IS30 family transposase